MSVEKLVTPTDGASPRRLREIADELEQGKVDIVIVHILYPEDPSKGRASMAFRKDLSPERRITFLTGAERLGRLLVEAEMEELEPRGTA